MKPAPAPAPGEPSIAYFSMEIALEPELPTYSGGLGVLAGDTLRSCADLGLPVRGLTLVHRQGYFRQHLAENGAQLEAAQPWRPEDRLEPLPPRVEVSVAGRRVAVRTWRYLVRGATGRTVEVLLLDTHLPENEAGDRALTDRLYGGDEAYRLAQEVVLGVGGVRMLRALGVAPDCYHLNEGHAALVIPELLAEDDEGANTGDPVARVRDRCVFTTHTPVPAGHDRFPADLVARVLEPGLRARLARLGIAGELNMTALALEGAHFVNGVAMRHGEVSRDLFPGYPIRSITNGVHPGTWAAPPFGALFDRSVPGWRSDPFSLRCITAVDPAEIEAAHGEAKAALLAAVEAAGGPRLDPRALTLGFARRATAYKRPLLVLRDLERLAEIARRTGPLQLLFGGKAHPRDEAGRRAVREIQSVARRTPPGVEVAFVADYDMARAGLFVAGSDVWLNTPVPPLEASGTSGMKAALNGVPSLSILDGWWVEGCVEGVTGWAIGRDGDGRDLPDAERDALQAGALYDTLERNVAPLFHAAPAAFARIRRQAIALNGSYFHSHRMVLQYQFEAYRVGSYGGPRDSRVPRPTGSASTADPAGGEPGGAVGAGRAGWAAGKTD